METTAVTPIGTEYIMTLHAPTGGPAHRVDAGLIVYRTGGGGWVKGPKIQGAIVQPTADWLRVTAGGSMRVDARMILETDDHAVIYVSYGGVIRVTPENFARMSAGDTLTSEDMYFIITPSFQTSHESYAWLNHVQAVGKVSAVKGGERGFVRYDVFAVR